jgi:TonB-linked SusC/RagA family outer membrane protein
MNVKTNVSGQWRRIALHMARIFLIVIVGNGFNQSVYAQTATYSFSFKNAPLDQVIDQVAKKSGYEFIFDAAYVQQSKPTTLEIKSASINQVLDAIFKSQNFSYEISRKTIILKPKVSNKADDEIYQVRGKVIDSTGVSFPGATVRVKGQRLGVQTDGNGNFIINVEGKNNTLLFNYIGYKEREFDVNPSFAVGSISIVLSPTASMLDEVFVNGFQTISRERGTGSYTVVSQKELNRNLNVDLTSALEGKVAGLVTTKNPTGKSADKLLLRGISTFSTDVGTGPLLVIDGLPTEYALEEINPYDIESVTVLKDAAASSIYGARSANGVIILTTKSGQGNGVKISLNADLFLTGKPDLSKMHYASTSDLIDFETAVYKNELSRFTSVENMFAPYGGIGTGLPKYYSPLYQLYRSQASGVLTSDQVNNTLIQWRQNDYHREYSDNVWQNEVRQRYNLSLSSATDKSNTYISLNFDQGQGRIINNANKSLNLNMKSTFKFKKWLTATFGLNGKYANDESTDADYDNIDLQPRYAQIIDGAGNRVISPYVNVDDGFSSGGALNGSVINSIVGNTALKSFGFNVLDALGEGITTNKNINLRTFANLEAKLYKGLSFSTQFQFENSSTNREQYYDVNSYKMRFAANMFTTYDAATAKYTNNLPSGGRFYQWSGSRNNYTFRNQLNFNRGFGKDGSEHYIAALAGFEMRQTYSPRYLEDLFYGYDPETQSAINYDSFKLTDAGFASYFGGNKTLGNLTRKRIEEKHRFTSVYANMSYTYRGKYAVTGSARIDQADMFGADPKYRNRPLWSAGASWNASNEDFLKDVSWLNFLKVRATYGINGNIDQSSSPYLLATRRTTDRLLPAYSFLDITTLPNPKLRWEKTASTNFGVDYGLFNNRLRGSIDFYNKYSSDLLVSSQLDPTVGALSIRLNNGATRNRGMEFSVGGDWFKTDDWTFASNIVFALNKNQVKEVNNSATTAYSYVGSTSNYFFINNPFNSLYAYKYGGMVNGYPYFLDENGNSNVTFDASGTPTAIKDITSPQALVRIGQLDPKYSGSFSQRISYNGLELSTMLVFSGGNKLRRDMTDLGSNDVTDMDITQRWNSTGTSDLPRLYLDYPLALANSAGTLSTLWQYADRQVLDASYVKLRNIALSYSLPKFMSHKLKVNSLKLTGQVNNLWYWSAAGDDIDPETYSLNSGTRSYAMPKSFLLGLNVTF